MKKKSLILICISVFLLTLLIFNGNFIDLTGQASKTSIIISVSPQDEIDTSATHINVVTSEKAKCMYNLGDKDTISFRYYTELDTTDEFKHKHLIKGLDDGEYELSIKCSDESGFVYRKDFDLIVNLPEECVPYCQYIDDCDEYAQDGCGETCDRDTEGISCGEGMSCNNGFCVFEEKPVVESSKEIGGFGEPVFSDKKESFADRFFGFFRSLFR